MYNSDSGRSINFSKAEIIWKPNDNFIDVKGWSSWTSKVDEQAGAELGQAQLKLELELC